MPSFLSQRLMIIQYLDGTDFGVKVYFAEGGKPSVEINNLIEVEWKEV